MKDEDLTPVETPEAIKRSKSGELRLGLADCPACHGSGKVPLGVVPNAAPCGYCDGGGRVTLARHHEYIGLKNIHETPIPPTEPDPNDPGR